MARLIALSSQVARGAVGLSIIVPALQRLGHDVIAVPTVILSNHPAPGRAVAGLCVAAGDIARILDALDANGWLSGVDGVLTGYLPSAETVAAAAGAVKLVRQRSPGALVLCDPVLGDDPNGLYIAQEVADAVRDVLLPLADLATPNRFELAYLSGREVRSSTEAARNLDCLSCGGGIATSIPAQEGYLENVISWGGSLAVARVAARPNAPHGTGDLMAALLLAELVTGSPPNQALGTATAAVDAALVASVGRDRLSTGLLPLRVEPWPVKIWGLHKDV